MESPLQVSLPPFRWVESLLGAVGIRDHQWGDIPQVVTSSQSTPYLHSLLFSGLPEAELREYFQVRGDSSPLTHF